MRNPRSDGAVILRVGIVASLLFAALVLATWALDIEMTPAGPTVSAAPVGTAAGDTARVASLGELSGEIGESSGVAVSRRHEGVLWTHEDQGHPAVLHAVGTDGALRGSVQVAGAEAVDWEDVALGPCPSGGAAGGDCLFVADIGDNEAGRTSVTVWVVPEPEPGAASVDPLGRIDFTYPEGPADAEALALEPGGDLLVVTKGQASGAARLYRVPLGAGDGQARVEATALGALPLSTGSRQDAITGAAVSPDGRHLAVRSHAAVYLFSLDGPLDRLSSPVVCQVRGLQPQGEGVDFLDDRHLVLTSEAAGGPAPLIKLRCP